MSEQKHYYTDEKNAQIVIALLKAHGIRKVIANPGTTNIAIVGSVQNDPWFEVYSGVDERHSAYMAVGMAAASGEPVVLSCTGATASRNYIPALTEAYYRKLPILAITSMHSFNAVGQLAPQVLDRTVSPNDVFVAKYSIQTVGTDREALYCANMINAAIHALRRRGGGPVHVNLEESGVMTFNARSLPQVQKISYHSAGEMSSLPEIARNAKIALFLGSGKVSSVWNDFVACHNVAVIASGDCGYSGSKRVYASLLTSQKGFCVNPKYAHLTPDLIVDAGEVSGDYPSIGYFHGRAPVWRVSEDGELRDRFKRLTHLFDMPVTRFVEQYAEGDGGGSYFESWSRADADVRARVPDFPFSNPWISKTMSKCIPNGSVIHFGILNSLRSWNLFPVGDGILTSSNVGGFGIDGGVSTLIGASLATPDKLHFGVFGDLAFFYDLNSLGNRHIGKNLRILLVNNGCGGEFNMYFHPGSQFKEQTNDYIAAGGHFGQRSRDLVRHYVIDLGFKYLCASNKEEFSSSLSEFLDPECNQSIVFECFTEATDESKAHEIINGIESFDVCDSSVNKIKSLVPNRIKNAVRELVK
jgi:2-succinyl-5-enolpyruvyl-6-hydroxy-3-cyclohexene-1-carboxylate synthase